jgi:hypothetical protein
MIVLVGVSSTESIYGTQEFKLVYFESSRRSNTPVTRSKSKLQESAGLALRTDNRWQMPAQAILGRCLPAWSPVFSGWTRPGARQEWRRRRWCVQRDAVKTSGQCARIGIGVGDFDLATGSGDAFGSGYRIPRPSLSAFLYSTR